MFESDFLNKELITYMGNKRKLIPFISGVIDEIVEKDSRLQNKVKFFDMFSGTGVVSRLARSKGFNVIANDLENYSHSINKAFLQTNPDELDEIFEDAAKSLGLDCETGNYYQCVLDYLNSIKQPSSKYFSEHYAPKDTNNFNTTKERLTFTQENAAKLDAILEVVHEDSVVNSRAKDILLASVLAGVSRINNSTGHWKTYFKGFDRPNVNRELMLKPIPLIEGDKAEIFSEYSETIFYKQEVKSDIVYIDPPYNQHNYSANYSILNSICLNDKKEIPSVSLKVGGIRDDYLSSDFAQRSKHKEALRKLMYSLDTKYAMVSYNCDGFLTEKEMKGIISRNGKYTVKVFRKKHRRYSAGESSIDKIHTQEKIFLVKYN